MASCIADGDGYALAVSGAICERDGGARLLPLVLEGWTSRYRLLANRGGLCVECVDGFDMVMERFWREVVRMGFYSLRGSGRQWCAWGRSRHDALSALSRLVGAKEAMDLVESAPVTVLDARAPRVRSERMAGMVEMAGSRLVRVEMPGGSGEAYHDQFRGRRVQKGGGVSLRSAAGAAPVRR